MPTQAGAVSEGMCSGARRLSPSASRMEGSERVEGLGQSHLDGGRGGTSGARSAVGRGLLLRPPRHWVPRQVWSGRGRLAEPTSHPCWGADRSRHRRVSLLFLPGEEAKRCEKDRLQGQASDSERVFRFFGDRGVPRHVVVTEGSGHPWSACTSHLAVGPGALGKVSPACIRAACLPPGCGSWGTRCPQRSHQTPPHCGSGRPAHRGASSTADSGAIYRAFPGK